MGKFAFVYVAHGYKNHLQEDKTARNYNVDTSGWKNGYKNMKSVLGPSMLHMYSNWQY